MKNIYGGGKQTNLNGLRFEQETNLNDLLVSKGYKLEVIRKGKKLLFTKLYKDNGKIVFSCPKSNLYNYLDQYYPNSRNINSKKWQPDECLINEITKEVFIIEKKFQNTSGSVDEKLPNCEFKLEEYQKLFNKIGFTVKFIYVFNDWFKRNEYVDTLKYIEKKDNCSYYFNEIPIEILDL